VRLDRIVYLDHAATSWPKPPVVAEAMVRALTEAGGNPGRGAHELALAASRAILEARGALAALVGVRDTRDLVFTPGCTYGMNLVLHGSLRPGDRVVVSGMEHNAVVRPLTMLAKGGVEVVVVAPDAEGHIDPDDVEAAVRERMTTAVVCQHASNVTGSIQPIGDLADIAHERGAVLLVDGAQGAGHLELDVTALGADAYAFSGHKGLLGPQGVGALYLAGSFEPDELIRGGSGGHSGRPEQPTVRPDRYESGTLNTPGIAALGAAATFLAEHGAAIRAEERRLTRMLHEGLLELPGLRVLGPPPSEHRVPVVSVTSDRMTADEIAFALERTAGIAVRAGLHCAPWAHAAVGTAETGTVRFSLGYGTTEPHVETTLAAMRELLA